MALSGKELAKHLIATKKVVVISKSYCPFCVKAKKVLAKYTIAPEDIEILEIDDRSDCDEIQAFMKELTKASSVPRVFIGGKCIGGGDDTASLDGSGKLREMLKEVKAIQ